MEELVESKPGGLYSCRLCLNFKPLTKWYAERHFKEKHGNHKCVWGGHVMFICLRGCSKNGKGHYHCYRCNKTFDRKKRLETHLGNCATGSVVKEKSVIKADEPSAVNPDEVLGAVDGHENSGEDKVEGGQPGEVDVPVCVGEKDGEVTGVDKDGLRLAEVEHETDLETVENVQTEAECGVDPVVGQVPVGSADNDLCQEGDEGRRGMKVKCHECGDSMWRQNLKNHIARVHTPKEEVVPSALYEGACVDKQNGVYLISETRTGVQHPIHVQKLIRGNAPAMIYCESKECLVERTIKGMSGEPTWECPHLLSANRLVASEEVVLDEEGLNQLVTEQRISEETKKDCLLRKRDCEGRGVELVSAMTPKHGTDRWIFVSVWTGYRKWYSPLRRVVITFDKTKFKLVCRCSGSSRIGCAHKPIAKWFLRTVYQDLFLSKANPVTYLSDKLRVNHSVDIEYLYAEKRIQVDMEMPVDQFPSDLVICPQETVCPFANCAGNLVLGKSYEKVKLLTRSGFVIIRRVWTKQCATCSAVVSHHNANDGYLNWNNKFFVSIAMLLWLLAGIREHKAIGTDLTMVEKVYRVTITHQIVRLTFYKFLALLNDDDSFCCYLCGYHPVILTFDVTRKVAFKLGKDSVRGAQNEEVNVPQFWDNVRKYLLSPESNRSLMPSMECWAPFIPQRSRKGDMALNTEFNKGVKDDEEQKYLKCLSAESLEGLLDISDVKMLRDLCAECGIKAASASKFKCMELLFNALKNNTRIDKFFLKLWHSSGGVLTATCPHEIVYCVKFLLKPESVRDMADIILSLKYPPSIIVSDVPHNLAPHLNRRAGREFFNPHCGRLVEPTEDNIQKVEKKTLDVSLGWLDRRFERASTDLNIEGTDIHPISQTTNRYSLYDKFHEKNTSQREEFVRRTGLVRELVGMNTETAEQVNGFLYKSLSYIDCTSPVHHIMEVKAILAVRNREINAKILGARQPLLDVYGRLVTSRPLDQQQQQQNSQPQLSLHVHSAQPLQQPTQPLKQPVTPSHPTQPSKRPSQPSHPTQPLQQSYVQQQSQPQQFSSQQSQQEPQSHKHKNKYALRSTNGDNEDQPPAKRKRKGQELSYSFKVSELLDEEAEDALYLDGEEEFLRGCFKGLPNPRNYCWVNSSIVAVRNTIGASRLWEDCSMGILESDDSLITALEPLFRQTGLIGAGYNLDGVLLESSLRKNLSSADYRLQQDPLQFFLYMCGVLDSMGPQVYGIETMCKFKCVNETCTYTSCKSDRELIVPLTLNPDRVQSTSVENLVRQYYCDENVAEGCKKCGDVLKISKRINNKPDVLAFKIQRYLHGAKRMDVVTPDQELNIAGIMTSSDSSCYVLNAVITHKGATMNSGHYTTTLMQDGVMIEVDNDKVSITEGLYLESEAYILLYENVDSRRDLMTKWYPLTLLLLGVVRCEQRSQSSLTLSLQHIWNTLINKDQAMIHCSEMLRVIARRLGRTVSFVPTTKSKKGALIALLDMIGYKGDTSCYFAAGFTCSCGLEGKHILKYDTLKCASAESHCIFDMVREDAEKKKCRRCPNTVKLDNDPVFLSNIFILETRKIDSPTLAIHSTSMEIYTEYSVLGGLMSSECFMHKNGSWFCTSGYSLRFSNSLEQSKPKTLLMKGIESTTNYHNIETVAVDIGVVPSAKDAGTHMMQLEACFVNICGKGEEDDDNDMIDLSLKSVDAMDKVVERLIFSELPFKGKSERQLLFSRLFRNSQVTSFESEVVFAEKNLGSVLTGMLGQVALSQYMVINMQESMIVINLVDDLVRVHMFGTSIDHTKKIVQLSKVLFPGAENISVSRIPIMGSACHALQLLKLVHCVTWEKPLLLDHDLNAALVTLFLKMPSVGTSGFEVAIKKKCRFYGIVPRFLTMLSETYDMPRNGELFVLPTDANEVTEGIQRKFESYCVGRLRDDVIPEVLNYIVTNKDLVIELYLLRDVNSASMRKLLRDYEQFHDLRSRCDFVGERREAMMKLYPSMLYFCMLAALEFLTSEECGPDHHVDNGVVDFQTFTVAQFIELHLVKFLVSTYVADICDLPHEVP